MKSIDSNDFIAETIDRNSMMRVSTPELIRYSAIDFEDVLLLTVGMLEEDRDVRERVRDQYRYFTVDESLALVPTPATVGT